jgi:hypothetical protein
MQFGYTRFYFIVAMGMVMYCISFLVIFLVVFGFVGVLECLFNCRGALALI